MAIGFILTITGIAWSWISGDKFVFDHDYTGMIYGFGIAALVLSGAFRQR